MVTVDDAHPNNLISELAKVLETKDEFIPPKWAAFVKTGAHKERPPAQANWWFTRAAAVLRTVYKSGPVGVSKLRSKYGGRQNRGRKPHKFKKGSGAVIRKILQQLEKAEFVKYKKEGVHKGRIITPKGQSMLNKAALSAIKNNSK